MTDRDPGFASPCLTRVPAEFQLTTLSAPIVWLLGGLVITNPSDRREFVVEAGKEYFLARHTGSIDVRLVGGVDGVVDELAGLTRTPPVVIRGAVSNGGATSDEPAR